MPTFTPPTQNVLRFVDFSRPERFENRLFRFFAPLPRGVNVYKLTDGTYTEADQSDATAYTVLYHGGHSHEVTAAEAAALTAAGYGAYLS
jgi:hypothetical protein